MGFQCSPSCQMHHLWRLNSTLQQLSRSKPTTIKAQQPRFLSGSLLKIYNLSSADRTGDFLQQPTIIRGIDVFLWTIDTEVIYGV